MRALLLVSLLAIVSPFHAQDKSPGYPAYERANSLFVAQKFPECLKAIDEALNRDPKFVQALTLRAKVEMAQNRFDAARQTLERAIKTDASSWYAHFLYGLQFYLQNEMQAAIEPLETARRLNPRESGPALYLGYTNESLGRLEQAVSFYQEAIRLERLSGKPQVETLLGCVRLLHLLGRLQEADRFVQDALQLEPKSRDTHFERARLLMKSGDATKAAAEAETALKLPAGVATDRQILYVLVRAYQAAGQESRASEYSQRLRALDP